MSYQLINNLFRRAPIPWPTETVKRTQTQGAGAPPILHNPC